MTENKQTPNTAAIIKQIPYLTESTSIVITLTPYMVLPLFATRFADHAGGIRVSFI